VDALLEDLRALEQGIDPSATGKFARLKAWSIRLARPRAAHRWPYVIGLLAGFIGLATAAVAWIDRARMMSLLPLREPPALSSVATPAAPPPVPREVVDAGTQVQGKRVDFILFPLDARLYDGKENLGPMPVSVIVPEGEKRSLIVRRPGYWPRRVRVDGSKSRIVIGLRALNAPKSAEPDKDEDSVEEIDRDGAEAPNTGKTEHASDPKTNLGDTLLGDKTPERRDGSPAATSALPLPSPVAPEVPPP
jgi:hypothetical protein